MDWIVPESFLLRMKSNSVGISQCLKNNQDRFKAGSLQMTLCYYKYKKIGIIYLDLCPADLCPIPDPAGSSSSAHIGTHVPK